MAGLPKKYAKMGFKKGWAEYKKSLKKRKSPSKKKPVRKAKPKRTRGRTTVARRTTTKRRSKKYTTISILGDIAPLGWGYTTVSGNQIGEVLDKAIDSIMNGNGDIAEIAMTEIQETLNNVTQNPVQVGVKLAIGVGAFRWISKSVGRKKVFTIGKFKLTT